MVINVASCGIIAYYQQKLIAVTCRLKGGGARSTDHVSVDVYFVTLIPVTPSVGCARTSQLYILKLLGAAGADVPLSSHSCIKGWGYVYGVYPGRGTPT